jgi:hypothetical protein
MTSTGRLTGSWERNHTIMFHTRQSAAPKLHFCKFVCSIYVVSHILRLSVLKWVFVRKFAPTVNHIWAGSLEKGRRPIRVDDLRRFPE